MDQNSETGIICQHSDEKKIVRRINAFLRDQYNYRKIYKCTNKSMLEARLPFRYEHFYYQFIKQGPRWFFELYPNSDLDGKMKFPEAPECAWMMWISKKEINSISPDQKQEVDRFFSELLAAIGFPIKTIYVYKDDEERL